jgi:hypothetical protein
MNPNGFNKIIQHTHLQMFMFDLNEFTEKNDTLQDITLKGLPKNVIPIVPISKTFQHHH